MTEEFREEIIGAIIDGMISEMTFEDLRQFVWNCLYDDLVFQGDVDLMMHAENYAAEFLEEAG
jgi:hypothetical protein